MIFQAKIVSIELGSRSGRRKSPYLHPGTRVVYWNFIRKGIREYSDGLVDLEVNPNSASPPHHNLEDQKSPDSGIDIDVTTVDVDEDAPSWHNQTDLSEVDFPTKCPLCPSSTEEIYLTEPSLDAHCRVSHGYREAIQ